MLTKLGLDFFRELIYYVAAKWQNGKIWESVMGKSKDATVHIPLEIHRELKIEAAKRSMKVGDLLVLALKKLFGMSKGENRNG